MTTTFIFFSIIVVVVVVAAQIARFSYSCSSWFSALLGILPNVATGEIEEEVGDVDPER